MEVTPLTVNYVQPGKSYKNATISSETNSQHADNIDKSKEFVTNAPKIGMCNLGCPKD